MSQFDLFKGKRQRGVRLPPAPEKRLQIMLADTLRRWADVHWRWTHFPAGELRTKATAALLQRYGTQPGITDFILWAPLNGGSFFLELKRRGRIRSTSEAQDDFEAWCIENGYPHAIVDRYEMALGVLKHWGALRGNIEVMA